ncbi:MAG: YbaN family protein [Reyranella sp.]|nr:YbaN family protein [Reyranella sp.]
MAPRFLWLLLGLGATGCGIAGAVLPLVPTTPFLLLGAFAFAKSSPRLHAWLMTHPQFGSLIGNWQQHRAIGRGAKRAALVFMGLALSLSWLLAVPGWALVVQAIVLACVATFILSRPDGPEGPQA